MKIACLSDLHIDFRNGIPIKICEKDVDVFILDGDISYPFSKCFRSQLTKLIAKTRHVIVVAGNHEYWNRKNYSLADVINKIKKTCDSVNIQANGLTKFHVLEKEMIDIDGYWFLGCTLWSMPTESDAETMNDFKFIPNWTLDKCHIEHLRSRQWLIDSIDSLKKQGVESEKIIVITHHLPSTKIITEYDELKNRPFFGIPQSISSYASLDDDLENAAFGKMRNWFCGHFHQFVDFTKNGTRFVINPIGYPNQATCHKRNLFINI